MSHNRQGTKTRRADGTSRKTGNNWLRSQQRFTVKFTTKAKRERKEEQEKERLRNRPRPLTANPRTYAEMPEHLSDVLEGKGTIKKDALKKIFG